MFSYEFLFLFYLKRTFLLHLTYYFDIFQFLKTNFNESANVINLIYNELIEPGFTDVENHKINFSLLAWLKFRKFLEISVL